MFINSPIVNCTCGNRRCNTLEDLQPDTGIAITPAPIDDTDSYKTEIKVLRWTILLVYHE